MTTKPNDGGPAFPQQYKMGSMTVSQYGMSLRDWFAGQALSGFLTWAVGEADFSDEQIANNCYCLADAMLKAREVRDDQA